ncbi:hypothetical protein SCIP_0937 [Scardovia inopinata JCM 12537]|nr:hypothetical protein SCIP_0937 [Scardovia inopinata JCM 12537]
MIGTIGRRVQAQAQTENEQHQPHYCSGNEPLGVDMPYQCGSPQNHGDQKKTKIFVQSIMHSLIPLL